MTQYVANIAGLTGDVACSHCGLPVAETLLDGGENQQFCCDGCRTVFAVIHGAGLDRYYFERAAAVSERRRSAPSGRSHAELDDRAFLESYTRPAGPGLSEVELYLEGMHCPACVWLVEKLPRVAPGVVSATVDLSRSTVRVVWPPGELALSRVARALDSLGYTPHARQTNAAELRRAEDRRLLARMAVAGAIFGNVMLLALALYSGAFQGMDAEYQAFFRWASLIVVTPTVAWCAGVFYRGAWAAFRLRTPHMDLPVAIGVLAGYLSGAVNVLRGRGEIYFDSVAAVVFLLLVGRWVQRRAQHAAKGEAEVLQAFAPARARVMGADGIREVRIEAVAEGDLLDVRSGEHVPADGTVVEGSSTIDASLLSGETRPEEIAPGDEVCAGTINVAARIVVRAQKTGAATRVGRLLASVEEAAARRAPIALAADRAAGRFVLAVIGLALITALVWWRLDPTRALDNAIALLVVTCPCALGLATPLAVSAAIGKAARRGVLVKGGDALEKLARGSLVVFDKTGTLTEGRLELTRWEGDARLRPLVAAAEALSAHPIAQACVRGLGKSELVVESSIYTPGGGLSATVAGRSIVVGSVWFVGARARVPEPLASRAREAALEGETAILVAEDGTARALACFADPLRSDAATCLAELARMGHRIAILSGDQSAVVDSVARRLGVPLAFARGGASPEDKLAAIDYEAERGSVVMVGDGVNDAAALARAGVGIAVHGGAEASLAVADVFTTTGGVAPVLWLFQGATRTLGVIRRNMLLSLGYNLVCAALAVGGLITPWIAAILMPLSSLTVVTRSYRSRTFEVPT